MTFARLPGKDDFVRFSPDVGPRYLVTVDVEEEFDWTKPIEREGYSLEALEAITDFQTLCEEYGVKPLYLVDWPIISDPRGKEIYGQFVREGRAEVGIQLHPWVNPPFDEEVTQRNTYAGNLPVDLERAKFFALDLAARMLAGRDAALREAARTVDSESRFAAWMDHCAAEIARAADTERAALFRERVGAVG